MAKRKSDKSKPQTFTFTDARPDPLYQAFDKYWKYLEQGLNQTAAVTRALVDAKCDDINPSHFRRLARQTKDPIAEAAKSRKENRDFKLIELMVRRASKLPVDRWDQFEAAFHDSGLPAPLLDIAKIYLLRVGYKQAKKG